MRTVIEKKVNTKEPYLIVNKADVLKAMTELNEVAFKVYIALMSNQDGYSTEHMQKHVQDDTGLKANRVSEAFVTLRNKGYIQVDTSTMTETIRSDAGEPCTYRAERKPGRNNRKPKTDVVEPTTIAEDEFDGNALTKSDYYSGKGEIVSDEMPF